MDIQLTATLVLIYTKHLKNTLPPSEDPDSMPPSCSDVPARPQGLGELGPCPGDPQGCRQIKITGVKEEIGWVGEEDAQSSEDTSGLDRSRQGLKGQHNTRIRQQPCSPGSERPQTPAQLMAVLLPVVQATLKHLPGACQSFMLRASTDE